jgi:hypothetical protein
MKRSVCAFSYIKHLLSSYLAPQKCPLVFRRANHRPRGSPLKHQCQSTVHRVSHRNGMGTIRFVSCPLAVNYPPTNVCNLESVARDLESFAKHAGRTQISTDDVMLLARRNEGLEALLRSYVEKIRKEKDGAGRGGRR